MTKRNYFTLDDMLKITDFKNHIVIEENHETIFRGRVEQFYQSNNMKRYYSRNVHSINHQNVYTFIKLL